LPSPVPSIAAVNRGARPGVIELEIAGAQLRLRGPVDETMLSSVLRALRQSE
jgi:transposase